MSFALKIALAALAFVVPAGYVFYSGALSSDNWVYQGSGNWTSGGYHGAPGPVLGAGLPVLAVGYGVYWLVRRRRKPD